MSYSVPNESGSVLSDVTLINDSMFISSGGTAVNTVVDDYAQMDVYSGGSAMQTALTGYDARINVYSGGLADGVTGTDSYNALIVYDGGTVKNAVLDNYGRVYVYAGGVISGLELLTAYGSCYGEISGLVMNNVNAWMNVYEGGTLYFDISEDLPNALPHMCKGGFLNRHALTIKPGTFMETIYGDSDIRVNSRHHQCICDVAENFEATGWCPDDVIEVIDERLNVNLTTNLIAYDWDEITKQYTTLQYGDTGDAVKALQRKLKELGYFTGSIGGNYLTITPTAVEDYQRANGLTVDGVATPDLR